MHRRVVGVSRPFFHSDLHGFADNDITAHDAKERSLITQKALRTDSAAAVVRSLQQGFGAVRVVGRALASFF